MYTTRVALDTWFYDLGKDISPQQWHDLFGIEIPPGKEGKYGDVVLVGTLPFIPQKQQMIWFRDDEGNGFGFITSDQESPVPIIGPDGAVTVLITWPSPDANEYTLEETAAALKAAGWRVELSYHD